MQNVGKSFKMTLNSKHGTEKLKTKNQDTEAPKTKTEKN